jgi:predicted transcriptional regulator
LSVASKRRQGGKVETHSDLVRGRELAELEEVVIAVIRGERNQEQ